MKLSHLRFHLGQPPFHFKNRLVYGKHLFIDGFGGFYVAVLGQVADPKAFLLMNRAFVHALKA